MLSSTQSRRILHLISVCLALMVFGYGLFLKYAKEGSLSNGQSIPKTELVNHVDGTSLENDQLEQMSEPD